MALEDLCLACGLCCRGALHSKAPLREDEHAVIVEIGARPTSDGEFFRLPCPAHDGGRCTIYERRPQGCDAYVCDVYSSVRLGERSEEEALDLIASLQRLVAGVEEIVGGTETGLPLNNRLARYMEDLPDEGEQRNAVLLKWAVLNIERSKFEPRAYFDPREEKSG